MEKRTSSIAIYAFAAISALVALVSMFFNFVVVRGVAFRRTGFSIFQSGSILNIVLVVAFIIVAVSVMVLTIARAGGKMHERSNGRAITILGVIMAILSFVLFMTVTRISWAGFNHTATTRGAGLIVNLVFSILTALLCFAPMFIERPTRHHHVSH
ncbi:MAG: hypothetical protein FWD86_01530 [Firmicutes bacterium]|nr:hypothetical protein [Bacillota bacterium]